MDALEIRSYALYGVTADRRSGLMGGKDLSLNFRKLQVSPVSL